MNFLGKLFGRKPAPKPPTTPYAAPPNTTVPSNDPATDPNLIRIHDAYGRELFVTKEQWRDSVLLGNLEAKRNSPDELASLIIGALNDGFAEDALPYATHLAATDTDPERGHILHGVTLLQLRRYTEAESVLLAFIRKHGESGVALTNLAKAYSGRGDESRALATLWRGLELDPNQDNGLGWYEVLHREKHGPAAGLEALRRVAALPGSWRARLWLARERLEQRDLNAALVLYRDALSLAPRPTPTDLLFQMSGDLGKQAHLSELLQLTEPHFDVALHGLAVGNNLIKAHLDLGQIDAARAHLEALYAQKRPDWKAHLAFWDTEIAKASTATADAVTPDKLEITLLSLPGPVWLPTASPAADLFPAKPAEAPVVAFLGSSAEMPPSNEPYRPQLSDGPGRLSRALPLFLSEQVEFSTEATTRTLVPWIVKPSSGFVLSGAAWSDAEAASQARHAAPDQRPADFVVITHLRCRAEPWRIELRLIRTIDSACLADTSSVCTATDVAKSLPALVRELLAALAKHADITSRPTLSSPHYQPATTSHYLLRLEQLLATRTAAMDGTASTLNGEREILDGHLQLCLENPLSVSIRLLFVHTLRAMKKVRPDILPEFRDRVQLLQREKTLPEPAHAVTERVIAEAFSS